jgi:hypothetical protein
MPNVPERELQIFKALMQRYKSQWDMNQKTRSNYDEDLEYYLGYRNASSYPLAYNESFNRILPIIYTILSRFMDQIFQSGNIVAVKPRKSQNLESAKSVEAVLNFQMENLNSIDMQGGAYLTMYKWFFNCLTFGKGILKTYWRKEERISPNRVAVPVPSFDRAGGFQGWETIDHIKMEPQIVYDGPYCEVLHNKTFIPHPEYKNIQQMPAVFLVYKRSIDYVKRMVDLGVYRREALDGLGWDSAGGAGVEPRDSCEAVSKSLEIEGYTTFDDSSPQDDFITKELDILECYTKLILEDEPYEVGSGMSIKGKEEECIVHIGNYKRILSLQRNVYGCRPLFDIGAYLQPELYWDVGLVRLTKGIQEQANNLANLRMQDIMMKISTMLRVDPNWDGNADELVWRPFGLVEAAQGDIEPIVLPDLQSNIFVEQEEFFKGTIQDLMGMYDYNMGATPQRQERVGVVYGIQSMGEARAKLMLMTIDYMGIRPLLKYFMLLNTFHLPNGFEYRISNGNQNQFGNIFSGDIHPDYDFAARYTSMEPALGKAARLQQLMNLAQIMLQNPWINQYQWWRTIFELGDIREADYLLKTPQQYQQEQQAMQQAQMMQAQMGLQAERAKLGWETEADIFKSHKDFGEEKALEDQRFKHEVALTMVEGDIKNEQAKSAKRAAKAA